jgi:hypothetical protein
MHVDRTMAVAPWLYLNALDSPAPGPELLPVTGKGSFIVVMPVGLYRLRHCFFFSDAAVVSHFRLPAFQVPARPPMEGLTFRAYNPGPARS